MRITKSQLKYIIQEELSQVLREADKGPPEGMSSEAWAEVLRKERETMEFPPKPVQVDVSGEFDRPVYIQGDPNMSQEELEALEAEESAAEQEYVYRHGVPADAKPGQYSVQGPGTDYK